MENKFAPIPLTLPLCDNIHDAFNQVTKITQALRDSFGEIYAAHALTYYGVMFLPKFVSNYLVNESTKPFTSAFSNLPGLLKPIHIFGSKSIRLHSFIITGGRLGLTIGCISYNGHFRIALTVDEAITK